MKRNGLRILHIAAVVVASIMLILGAVFGSSAADRESNNPEYRLTKNIGSPKDGGMNFTDLSLTDHKMFTAIQ